jgi:hypothetical protein
MHADNTVSFVDEAALLLNSLSPYIFICVNLRSSADKKLIVCA